MIFFYYSLNPKLNAVNCGPIPFSNNGVKS
jgi:hypothetical protein